MAVVSIPTSLGGVSLPGALGKLASGPLSSLYSNSGLDTYNYPRDLATDPSKSHYVTFSIKEIVPAGFTSNSPSTGGNSIKPLSNVDSLLGSNNNSNSDSSSSNYVNGVDLQSDQATTLKILGKGIGDALKIVSGLELKVSPRLTNPVKVISLYMPDTLEANYNSHYTEMSLASDTGLLQTIRELNQVAGDVGKAIGTGNLRGALMSLGKSASTDPVVIDLATKVANKAGVDIGQLGSFLLKGQGYAINPQMQMLYQGISLREFTLSFIFTPKTETDSQTIDKILWIFKNYSLPTLTAGSQTSTDSLFLIPPAIFNVNFFNNNKENQYLPKYGDCALMDVGVNYAPNGWAAFDNGAPVQTTLSLHFKEIQALDRGKIGSITNRTGDGVLR
jgi:hypothetical protein